MLSAKRFEFLMEKIEKSQDLLDPKSHWEVWAVFLLCGLCLLLSFWMREQLKSDAWMLVEAQDDIFQKWVRFGYECAYYDTFNYVVLAGGLLLCVFLLFCKGSFVLGSVTVLGGMIDLGVQLVYEGCVAGYVSYPIIFISDLIGIHTLLIAGGSVIIVYTLMEELRSRFRGGRLG